MPVFRITFNAPGPIKPSKLADATEKALEVLRPWWSLDSNDPNFEIFKPISDQARSYVRAIDSSIVAAQQGYNISEDALQLSQAINENTPPNEQTDFARSMVGLANHALNKASESINEFRDVRKNLFELIRTTQGSLKGQQHKQLDQLEKSIPILEDLLHNISNYISWWGWMQMSTKAVVDRTQPLDVKYSSLRKNGVAKQWEEIREGFVQYTLKIGELQDTYPTMFQESRGDRRKGAEKYDPESLMKTIESLRRKRVSVLGIEAECVIM